MNIFKITLRGGEIVEMTPEEYAKFLQEYEAAHTGTTLISLVGNRRVAKSKIEETNSIAEGQVDLYMDTLRYWYGTTNIISNWIDYRTDFRETTAIDRLIQEDDRRGQIMWLLDRYDKFPPELQRYLKKPSTIYKYFKEIGHYAVENIARKYNGSVKDLVDKMLIN